MKKRISYSYLNLFWFIFTDDGDSTEMFQDVPSREVGQSPAAVTTAPPGGVSSTEEVTKSSGAFTTAPQLFGKFPC